MLKMDKKIKYLSVIPLYGTCALYIHLYIMCLKDKISKSKFYKIFTISAAMSSMCWLVTTAIVYMIGEKITYFNFNNFGLYIALIVGGYIMNAVTFKYVDKNWTYLFCNDGADEKIFSKANINKIIIIAFVLAIIITILTLVMIFALGLV
jgi:hypothetical protein